MSTIARVRRGGQAIEIDAEELVPGDVVLMEAGNRVGVVEMNDTRRGVLLAVLALVVIGLLAFARGPEHHRGPQQVGGSGDDALSVAVAQL